MNYTLHDLRPSDGVAHDWIPVQRLGLARDWHRLVVVIAAGLNTIVVPAIVCTIRMAMVKESIKITTP